MNKIAPLIYVVDDDASVREALGSLIRSAGLEVETFASAQEFLACPRADVPSCLVLDVQLPGLSGLDLQQELAKADIQIPIIFLTGHGDIPMSVRAIKAGALEFLTKPFNDEDLLDAIQQGIARNQRPTKPTEERCFSMKWAIFRWSCSPSFCASCRNRSLNGWEVPEPYASTCG